MNESPSRRDFLKLATLGMAGLSVSPAAAKRAQAEILQPPSRSQQVSANDRIGLATIGMGIIGFIDTETALQVPGVELIAAADCYDSRRVHTREVFGKQVETTRKYEEILERSDVDAVIISVPDHWHARIAMDAMNAGKAVYCEKPMVQDIAEGSQVIQTERTTKQVFQVGSQYASSILYEKARELYRSGAIGELNLVEARYNRNSSIGAWQYSIPPDASPQTIDWQRFLGNAPNRPFDPVRFFRWRNYWDYGTGIPGDLYVHLFTAIHKVLDSDGPSTIMATGGLRFWHDGREVPDIMVGMCGYEETDSHPEFTLSLQTNFEDGSGGGSMFRFIGDEGALEITGNSVTLTRAPRRGPSANEVLRGYNSVRTWSEEVQQEFAREWRASHTRAVDPPMDESTTYRAPDGYNDQHDHLAYFFESVREGTPVYEDSVFGFRAAAPAVLTNTAYRENRIVAWDPENMKVAT